MSLLIFLFLVFFVLAVLLLKPNNINPYTGYTAQVVKHSVGWLPSHLPMLTFYLRYPRVIHAEMMTHKDFSRSASSSRAIPVARMLKQVWNDPAIPIHWGQNQPGMQAERELPVWKRNFMRNLWQLCARVVCVFVWVAMKMGLHKQTANRLLEPWQWMHVTLTTCKLANFFHLRIHKDAQPEIRHLTILMQASQRRSTPVVLQKGEWHLPWIEAEDVILARQYVAADLHIDMPSASDERVVALLKKMSAARCARSSYANFNGERNIVSDQSTFSKLVESTPVHASPCEHQATPDSLIKQIIYKESAPAIHEEVWEQPHLHGNLTGYIQYRNTIADHYIPDPIEA